MQAGHHTLAQVPLATRLAECGLLEWQLKQLKTKYGLTRSLGLGSSSASSFRCASASRRGTSSTASWLRWGRVLLLGGRGGTASWYFSLDLCVSLGMHSCCTSWCHGGGTLKDTLCGLTMRGMPLTLTLCILSWPTATVAMASRSRDVASPARQSSPRMHGKCVVHP